MDIPNRTYLSGPIRLSGREDGSSPAKYTVQAVIGEGSSSVCYEAVKTLANGTKTTGKLKEFYPLEIAGNDGGVYYSLERQPDGQLVAKAGTVRKFAEMCREYIRSYELLQQAMVDGSRNEVLKNYIQSGTILYGCVEKGKKGQIPGDMIRPTVYIWSPGVAGVAFDTYLSGIRQNPEANAEHRLLDILAVMRSFTDCVKALHTAGLLHLDIKPSNFLVCYDSDFNIRPDSISLIDINTLWSPESDEVPVFGTEGFCAPEIRKNDRRHISNYTDIYSIGAMLFNAIVFSDDIRDGLYNDLFYDKISRLVKESRLIRASEINSDTSLKNRLCRILEKCLAKDPKKRYGSCSELKEDIEKAYKRLEMLLAQPKATNDEEVQASPVTVIQRLLYTHPLYESIPDAADAINVLVVGAGSYGQKFIDVALQAGQMSGISINITAVSDAADLDREAYLRFRPALGEFINVNGSLKGKENKAYGTLCFKGIEDYGYMRFTGAASQVNGDIVDALLSQSREAGVVYNYVFVSLGEGKFNKTIARLFSDKMEHSCPVCYVSGKEDRVKKADIHGKLYPVPVNAVNEQEIDRELDEMAFNTHISWGNTMNMDVSGARREFFENTYNRISSTMFALSIKYKLFSLRIACGDDLLRAADEFSTQVLATGGETAKTARANMDRMIWLEHRRWLIEKAEEGWTAPRDEKGELLLRDCVSRGSVKDEAAKTHPCMVRSSETSPLLAPGFTRAMWDEGPIANTLDELDAMSVRLHRVFRTAAKQFIDGEITRNESDLETIQAHISQEYTRASAAFREFRYAIRNIVKGDRVYSGQYFSYRKKLEKALEEDKIPPESRSKVTERLFVIDRALFPVIECNLYRDYKATDAKLIKKIPFILTYRHAGSVAMAFEDGKYQNGRNEAVFGNVAAATILCPERISYLYCFDKASDTGLLGEKLDAVLNYLGKRHVICSVSLICCCLKDVPDAVRDQLWKTLQAVGDKYRDDARARLDMENTTIYDVDDYAGASAKLLEHLQAHPVDMYNGSNTLFPAAYDNATFICGIEKAVPYFEFDWRKKEFTGRNGCGYLRYVKDSSFISIRDMFALMNATDNKYNMPDYADDYETLWSIYTGSKGKEKIYPWSVQNWNALCEILRKYNDSLSPLAKIKIEAGGANVQDKTLTYFLPVYTYQTVKYILNEFITYGIAGKRSDVVPYAGDSCRLEMTINGAYEQEIARVFADPRILLPYYEVSVEKVWTAGAYYAVISYNNMKVTDVVLNSPFSDKLYELLNDLEKANFIRRLEKHDGTGTMISAGFVYSSPRIKKLLTQAGEILEVYAYYEALKTGYFDDVASGFEFNWREGGVKNELDLVLVKGFRSIIVECKARQILELDFYHKLHSIADQFGIGTTKVLLSNNVNRNYEVNEMQVSRGSQLHIVTISDPADIHNIGQTLVRLMEGK